MTDLHFTALDTGQLVIKFPGRCPTCGKYMQHQLSLEPDVVKEIKEVFDKHLEGIANDSAKRH